MPPFINIGGTVDCFVMFLNCDFSWHDLGKEAINSKWHVTMESRQIWCNIPILEKGRPLVRMELHIVRAKNVHFAALTS